LFYKKNSSIYYNKLQMINQIFRTIFSIAAPTTFENVSNLFAIFITKLKNKLWITKKWLG